MDRSIFYLVAFFAMLAILTIEAGIVSTVENNVYLSTADGAEKPGRTLLNIVSISAWITATFMITTSVIAMMYRTKHIEPKYIDTLLIYGGVFMVVLLFVHSWLIAYAHHDLRRNDKNVSNGRYVDMLTNAFFMVFIATLVFGMSYLVIAAMTDYNPRQQSIDRLNVSIV